MREKLKYFEHIIGKVSHDLVKHEERRKTEAEIDRQHYQSNEHDSEGVQSGSA